MNPQYNNQPIPPQTPYNPLAAMQPGEQVICEIKRHPFGILTIYLAEGLMLIVLAVIAFIVAPHVLGGDGGDQVKVVSAIFFFLIAVASLVFVFIANVVYWGNRWVVTSDSITQITQTSLFHKQSSQLSLDNLEDVTSEQNGILASLLHFGLLRAETAGERSKFVFLYCPNPNYYAQKILAAREVFDQARGGQNPAQPNQDLQPAVFPQAPPPSSQPSTDNLPPQAPAYTPPPPAYAPPPPPTSPYPPPENNPQYPTNVDSGTSAQ
jgi:hypothetical protein